MLRGIQGDYVLWVGLWLGLSSEESCESLFEIIRVPLLQQYLWKSIKGDIDVAISCGCGSDGGSVAGIEWGLNS